MVKHNIGGKIKKAGITVKAEDPDFITRKRTRAFFVIEKTLRV